MSALSQIQRARMHTSLDGLSVGDAFGDRIFFDHWIFQAEVFDLPLAQRPLPAGRWSYTDDTQMALSIVEVLAHHGVIDQDALARSFGERFERGRGYGAAMYELLPRLGICQPWRTAAAALFGGQGLWQALPARMEFRLSGRAAVSRYPPGCEITAESS